MLTFGSPISTQEDVDVELDESQEWGTYNPQTDMKWYNILRDDPKNTYRWFLQLGFGTWILRDELKMLSRYDQEDPSPGKQRRKAVSKKPLWEFFEEFPKVYNYLRSNFGYIPSNTRIVEMAHAFVRNYYDSNIPFERLDDMLAFILGPEYDARRERRDKALKTRDSNKGKGQRNKGAAKDQDMKCTQAMVGKQLQDSLSPYMPEAIDAFAKDIRDRIKISLLAKDSFREWEKERAELMIEMARVKKAKKIAKGKEVEVSLDAVKLQSKRAETKYDMQWTNLEDQHRTDELCAVMKKVHWSGIKIGHGVKAGDTTNPFHTELRKVVPDFYKRNEVQEAKKAAILNAKADDKINLGKFFVELRGIAFDGKKNTINNKNLDGKSSLEILEMFVKADASKHMARIKKELKEKRKLTTDVMDLFGGETHYVERNRLTSHDLAGDEEDSDSDGEGDEERNNEPRRRRVGRASMHM